MNRPTLYLRCDSEHDPAILFEAGVNAGERVAIRSWANPLDAIKWMEEMLAEYRDEKVHGADPTGAMPGNSTPPFKGGWFGYLSYDVGRLFEQLPARLNAGTWPLFEFVFCQSLTTHDHLTGSWHQIEHKTSTHRPLEFRTSYQFTQTPLEANFSADQYKKAVCRAIEYIGEGDIFQVNLSQQFTTGLRVSPTEIFDRLPPSWFGAMLDFGDHALISNSPELYLRVLPDPRTGKRTVITRPIKGTRPFAPGMDMRLRDSIKDQAELNMIVDLERNDLGRICDIGTVKVSEQRTIEPHSTVYHGVAAVEGVLRSDVSFTDLLAATFPGGSITGAPKIRAMQIIEELEPIRRGPYCGAIGYLSIDGHIEFNIAIRTMLVKDGLVHIPVGGGIVADSDPAAEYEETLVKAQAMFTALGI